VGHAVVPPTKMEAGSGRRKSWGTYPVIPKVLCLIRQNDNFKQRTYGYNYKIIAEYEELTYLRCVLMLRLHLHMQL